MKIKCHGKTYDVNVVRKKAMDGKALLIQLYCDDGSPFARLTTFIPGFSDSLKENQAYVDTNNIAEAEEFIVSNGIGKPLSGFAVSGYCTYPLFEFNLDQISENY